MPSFETNLQMIPESLVISSHDLDMRLDKLLAERFPDHSRMYFQFLIDKECVLLNGLPIKKQHRVKEGDHIAIFFQHPPAFDVQPEEIPLEILYEDEHILAINKPSGMVVHPAPGSFSGTFANAFLHHCKNISREDFEPLRPGIVHRLDKETTGVLLAAKTLPAHKNLAEQFANRKLEKNYLAICCGVPKEGEYSASIKRHPIKRKEMTVSSDGKLAITHFKILARRKGLSLVSADLKTGRTHQIRIHLKSLRAPILGDPTYGSSSLNATYGASRQMLHAHTLKFLHPIFQSPLILEAPIPEDMKNFIDLIEGT